MTLFATRTLRCVGLVVACVATGMWAAPSPASDTRPEETLAEGIAELAAAAEGEQVAADIGTFLQRYADISRASRLILANHWKSADDEQRDRMHEALERRVTGMLAGFTEGLDFETVAIEPFDGDLKAIPIRVGVVLETAPEQTTRLELHMHPLTGEWRIVDVSLEGVSFLKMMQAQFRQDAAVHSVAEAIERFAPQESAEAKH